MPSSTLHHRRDITVTSAVTSAVTSQVMDYDRIGFDDLLGTASVKLDTLFEEMMITHRSPLIIAIQYDWS